MNFAVKETSLDRDPVKRTCRKMSILIIVIITMIKTNSDLFKIRTSVEDQVLNGPDKVRRGRGDHFARRNRPDVKG